VTVEVSAGPVCHSAWWSGTSVPGGYLGITRAHPGIQTGRERITNHAEWVSAMTADSGIRPRRRAFSLFLPHHACV
jgi:hypothetical protein